MENGKFRKFPRPLKNSPCPSIAGNEDGLTNRDIIEIRMTPDQIAEAQKLAREWMEKHPSK